MSTDRYVKFKCHNCEANYAIEFDVEEFDDPAYCPFCSDELDDDSDRDDEDEEERE